jgi:secreted Zn-dependent insulinase-like peptidase
MHRRHLQLAAGEQVVDAGLVEGVNAAWIGDYLLGDDSPRQRAASLVLGSFVSSPFMTELRTRQQLGYIVGASASVSLRERWLTFVIQSSTHGSIDLRQRAEAFIAGLPAALAALSDSEWATLKAGVRSRLEEKPTSIGQRAERLFAEAYLFDGDWGRGPAAVDALATLGQADAVALLSEALAPATARRRTVQLDPSSRPPAVPVAASFSDREGWKRTRSYR